MANEKDKNMRRQFKNEERMGGTKNSIPEILKSGDTSKPKGMTFTENEMQKRKEAEAKNTPTIKERIEEKQKALEAKQEKQGKERNKEKEHDKDK